MKKFFAFAIAAVVAGAISNVSAMDRTGKLALGFQETLTSGIAGAGSANALGAWSIKYGISSNMTGQLVIGADMITKGGNNRANIGARLLYDLVENEMSDFYTGLGLVFDIDKNNGVLRINIPLGFEFSFSGLPEVAFSAEAGIMYDYRTKTPKQGALSTVGGTAGGALGLGAHYYF